MLEQAFPDVLDSLGRSDFGTTFHQTDYARTGTKQTEREKVLDFMLGHFVEGFGRVRLLSLPGLDWIFEHMLLRARPDSHLVGLERSFTVFARSRRALPAGPMDRGQHGKHLQDRTITFGDGEVAYSRIAANRPGAGKCGRRDSRSNRLLRMDTATYASMFTTDYGATYKQKKEFHEKFYLRNAVWLDYTGTLCGGVESTLRHLPLCLAPDENLKPVVLTLRNGRDGFRGVEQRIARVLAVQPAFEYRRHWTYLGKGGVPMLTVCGGMP